MPAMFLIELLVMVKKQKQKKKMKATAQNLGKTEIGECSPDGMLC